MSPARQIASKPAPVQVLSAAAFGVLQRKCACGGSSGAKGECEECNKHKTSLQRRASGGPTPAAAPPIVHQVLRSSGQPLDSATRAIMEPRFAHDFSRVRVHAGDRAADSARAVSAKAYTVANQVVFNRGEYQPHSAAGLSTLAHELAHVVQQSAGGPGTIPEHITIGEPGAPEEREAEDASRMNWSRARLSNGDHPCLRRQPRDDDPRNQLPPRDLPKKGEKPERDLDPWFPIDFKPLFPDLPVDLPSTGDVQKGLDKASKKDSKGDPRCPSGWQMLQTGVCCRGLSVEPSDCCPPARLTLSSVCCASTEFASGNDCVKLGTSTLRPPPPAPEPTARSRFVPRRDKAVRGSSLLLNMDIYFKQNQPGTIVGDDKSLRDSLTVSGAGMLDVVVRWLKEDQNYRVQLIGKASIEGPPEHNRELGERRALSVAAVLAHQGVGRMDDPPGLPAPCTRLLSGIYNCGDTMSSGAMSERDRQVRARLFIPPESHP